MKKIILSGIIATVLMTSIMTFNTSSAQENTIPSWIKNTAGFWVEGAVSDSEFLNAIEFLINERVIQVSNLAIILEADATPTFYVKSDRYALFDPSHRLNGAPETISCDGGDIAISGGFDTNAFGVTLTTMRPVGAGPYGYEIGAINTNPEASTKGSATMYVTCMKT